MKRILICVEAMDYNYIVQNNIESLLQLEPHPAVAFGLGSRPSAAALMGGITGNAEEDQLRCLSDYGLKIGLGFQVADDILDVCATTDQLGKTAGKDAKAGKVTYPSVVGMDESKTHCQKLAREAIKALAPFGDKAQILRQLASAMVKRRK